MKAFEERRLLSPTKKEMALSLPEGPRELRRREAPHTSVAATQGLLAIRAQLWRTLSIDEDPKYHTSQELQKFGILKACRISMCIYIYIYI